MSTRSPLPTVSERDVDTVSWASYLKSSPLEGLVYNVNHKWRGCRNLLGCSSTPLVWSQSSVTYSQSGFIVHAVLANCNLDVSDCFTCSTPLVKAFPSWQQTSVKDNRRQPPHPACSARGKTAEESPHVGNYRLLKTIGKGNFAKVKLARHVLTGREVRGGHWSQRVVLSVLQQEVKLFFLKVAVKIIDKTQLNPTSLQKVRHRESPRTTKPGCSQEPLHITCQSLTHTCLSFCLSALQRSENNEDSKSSQHWWVKW